MYPHKNPNKNMKLSFNKTLVLGAAALVAAGASASAALTFDLRVQTSGITGVGVTVPNTKTVELAVAANGTVTLEVWAQVSAATNNGIWGMQSATGSIISSSTGVGAVGNMAAGGVASAPFDANAPNAGVGGELSGDSLQDLGDTATTTNAKYVKFAKPTTSGGVKIPTTGTSFFATNTSPNGSVNNSVTNGQGSGWEFLLGTVTLNITGYTAGTTTLNWVIPTWSGASSAVKAARGTFGENNTKKDGSINIAEMFVGSAVTIQAVPEPSAFGMVLIGALGLVGFRRLGFRRNS